MAIISKSYTFSAGATIIASEHNSNADTIYSDYNGNITNSNISGLAAIAYSKLTLASSIVNADVNGSAGIVASKLDLTTGSAIGTTVPAAGKFTTLEATSTFKLTTTNQGDILYDNGISISRLAAGTSGQFLKTQGTGANPLWAPVTGYSNCLFSFAASSENVGFVSATTLTTAATTNYTYWAVSGVSGSSYKTVITSKVTKTSGFNTVTVWGKLWQSGGGNTPNFKVDIGGQNSNVSGTLGQTTPEWKSLLIDVSSLTNGVTYDVTIQLANTDGGSVSVYLGSIVGIGT